MEITAQRAANCSLKGGTQETEAQNLLENRAKEGESPVRGATV